MLFERRHCHLLAIDVNHSNACDCLRFFFLMNKIGTGTQKIQIRWASGVQFEFFHSQSLYRAKSVTADTGDSPMRTETFVTSLCTSPGNEEIQIAIQIHFSVCESLFCSCD